MTKIVISRDRKLLLINGVRHVADGRYNNCGRTMNEACAVMVARVSSLGDREEHNRICRECCHPCVGFVSVAEVT